MKVPLLKIPLLFICLVFASVNTYAGDTPQVKQPIPVVQDTTTTSDNVVADETDDEFNLFLFSIATGAACFIAGFFFLGICAALLFIAILLMLISLGIISTSAFLGWYNKSLSTGFKVFWVMTGIIVGAVFAILAFHIAAYLLHLQFTNTAITISGLLIGAITGGFVGYTIHYILKKGFKYLTAKYKNLKRGVEPETRN